MYRTQRGLTLIELMVVVAIMAILAGVAYPLYTSQVQQSRRTDGRVAVTTIAAAQERYYSVNGRYVDNLASLSIDPTMQGGSSENGYYAVAVTATTTAFSVTATATGSQLADDCDSMTLTSTGAKSETGSDCW